MPITFVVVNTASPMAPASLTFDQPRVVIGRGAHADVRLPSRAVGLTHAVVFMDAAELSITDEGSTNGTLVNGSALVHGRKKSLKVGDHITVASFEITLAPAMGGPDPPGRTLSVARFMLQGILAARDRMAAPPTVTLATGKRAGEVWALEREGDRVVAGRGEGCDILLDDPDCSRQHAEVVRDADGAMLRDLGSTHGVMVGSRAVTERRLRDGDEIQLGRSLLIYHDPAELLLRASETGADEPVTRAEPPAMPPVPKVTAHAPPSSLSSADRRAPTLPPPPLDAPPKPMIPPPRSAAADWVVIGLALVILAVSAAALYVLLHTSPAH